MLVKTGDLRPDSHSDFDFTKKAEYVDEASYFVASEKDRAKLEKPKKVSLNPEK